MDKASASGAGDSRFESWADHWWQERDSAEVGEWPSACMKRAALAATKTFEGPKLGMPSARVAQRSHERAALAATKTFEGPKLRMPGNKADMTGAPHKASPALARSYTVGDSVR